MKYTAEILYNEIFENEKPKFWRNGQFVFNYIDEVYGIARVIQFTHKVDCFYDDSKIMPFLETAAEILNKHLDVI